MESNRSLATEAPTVAESMAAHEAATKAAQVKTRAANLAFAEESRKGTASKPVKPPKRAGAGKSETKPDPRVVALVAWRETATKAPAEVLEIVDAAIRRATATPRTTAVKASPADVAAFFASTGLTRKQIAEAVGVSTSVIGTVQSESGDRWSLTRFEAAKPLILAAAKKLAPKLAK
jgi:hypothetical protein